MKFKINVANDRTEGELAGGWWEPYDIPEVTDLSQAKAWAIKTIQAFNDTLRPHERPRRLLGVEEIIDDQPVSRLHEWRKQNSMTIVDRAGMHDVYRCDVCGITGKRFGLNEHVTRDRAFKAAAYEFCNTAQAQLKRNAAKKAHQNAAAQD